MSAQLCTLVFACCDRRIQARCKSIVIMVAQFIRRGMHFAKIEGESSLFCLVKELLFRKFDSDSL